MGDDLTVTRTTRPIQALGSLVVDASTAEPGRDRVRIGLRIPTGSRSRGGPFELRLTGRGLNLTGEAVEWLVTTNRGWTHFLATARQPDGTAVPIRCDLFAADPDDRAAKDLAVLRVYEPTANPSLAGPVARLRLELPPGSIRFDGRGASPRQHTE